MTAYALFCFAGLMQNHLEISGLYIIFSLLLTDFEMVYKLYTIEYAHEFQNCHHEHGKENREKDK